MLTTSIESVVFLPSPAPNTGMMGGAYYTRAQGHELLSVHNLITRSDTADIAYLRRSEDHGKTWSAAGQIACTFEAPEGTGRRHPSGVYVDRKTDTAIRLVTQGVLPSDDPLEGMKQWTPWYTTSKDGFRTQSEPRQIIHTGHGYDAIHHLPGITRGRNAAMIGDRGQCPITRDDGVILVPIQSSLVGPDGHYHNPGAGYTYTTCRLLMGTWQPDGSLSWTASEPVEGDPKRTTRGMIEPTITPLDSQRILMVMRGSNDVSPELPGHKWASISQDGGQSWSTPKPWCFSDQTPMFSPSSCSQLIDHTNGRLYWIGNQCETNPRGNSPRYPLVIIEVDKATGCLMRDTLTPIDDRRADESERLTLSNFYCREERGTGDLLIYYPRFFPNQKPDEPVNFVADLMETRVVLAAAR